MSSPCRREFLASSIVIGASDGFGEPLAVAGEAPDIWGQTILAQPFDKGPFREVKLPAWVQETTGVGYTLSGMDSAERKAAAEMGVTISEMGFVDPFYAYYDSKLLKRRSPHVPLGRLEKDIAEYKKLGVRILGVYPPSLQGEVYELHPDWRRIADQHRPGSPGRSEEVPARRHALPARAVRRLLHRRARRDPHAVPGRRRLQLRRPALRRRLLLRALPRRITRQGHRPGDSRNAT